MHAAHWKAEGVLAQCGPGHPVITVLHSFRLIGDLPMSAHLNTRRRQFVKSATALAGATLIGGVTSGCQGTTAKERQLVFASLDEALVELNLLASAQTLTSDAEWNWAQTLNHCAQSIEFSVIGFPKEESALFQRTLGVAAYEYFAWRGRMTHNIAEPIPGAPVLEPQADATVAADRLRKAIEAFQFWPAEFRPHFAYGYLTKAEYELAHAMHLANHFSMFHIQTVSA